MVSRGRVESAREKRRDGGAKIARLYLSPYGQDAYLQYQGRVLSGQGTDIHRGLVVERW